jgi:hypothetical protein
MKYLNAKLTIRNFGSFYSAKMVCVKKLRTEHRETDGTPMCRCTMEPALGPGAIFAFASILIFIAGGVTNSLHVLCKRQQIHSVQGNQLLATLLSVSTARMASTYVQRYQIYVHASVSPQHS